MAPKRLCPRKNTPFWEYRHPEIGDWSSTYHEYFALYQSVLKISQFYSHKLYYFKGIKLENENSKREIGITKKAWFALRVTP